MNVELKCANRRLLDAHSIFFFPRTKRQRRVLHWITTAVFPFVLISFRFERLSFDQRRRCSVPKRIEWFCQRKVMHHR